jgi:hypothetical protein
VNVDRDQALAVRRAAQTHARRLLALIDDEQAEVGRDGRRTWALEEDRAASRRGAPRLRRCPGEAMRLAIPAQGSIGDS